MNDSMDSKFLNQAKEFEREVGILSAAFRLPKMGFNIHGADMSMNLNIHNSSIDSAIEID